MNTKHFQALASTEPTRTMANPLRMKKAFLPTLFGLKLLLLFCVLGFSSGLAAQASLSIQGILKKTNGVTVDDGTYSLTFKLYDAPTGGTLVWDETQNDVEVSSGMYSAVLGNTKPLNVSFNDFYYLGISIGGGTELLPRVQLTSAPYALSLIGDSNKFPSTGVVKADSIVVKGGVLARGGAPGVNGANKSGYAFSGNNGDNDSGLFSSANGEVSLYANNTKVLEAKTGQVKVTGNIITSGNTTTTGSTTTGGLALTAGSTISYNNLDDWRLVDVDNFETDAEGWKCYLDINSSTEVTFDRTQLGPLDASTVLMPDVMAGNALKKMLNFNGIPHTQVKAIFTITFLNSFDVGEAVYGAFALNNAPDLAVSGQAIVGYCHVRAPGETYSRIGSVDGWTKRGEMVIRNAGDNLWLIFDSTMNEAVNNENYAISNIEIWVK